jgi:uncharacterized protein (TIGR02996 family)
MRTFVLNDRGRYKFWDVELSGVEVTFSQGQVGRPAGRTETMSFASAEQARQEHDKLIKEKTDKGYVETTLPDVPALPPAASLRDALERAILDDPSDLAAHAAYADWLSEQSSPADAARAELIRIQLALEGEPLAVAERQTWLARARALIEQHQRDWAGPWVGLARYDRAPEDTGQLDFPEPRPVRYVRGLPAEAVVGEASLGWAAAFATCPHSWLVRKLSVGGFSWQEPEEGPETPIPPELAFLRQVGGGNAVVEALKRWAGLANLRTFQLGWTADEGYEGPCRFRCTVSGRKAHELVARMPRLEEVYLFAKDVNGGALFALPMPCLRVLQVYHARHYPLERLAENAALANLTHLLLHPHGFEGEVSLTLGGLRALARSPHLKRLTHLRLRLTVFGDEGVKEIIGSGLLARLKTLDLRHGRVSDAGAKLLAARPEVKGLELLDLSRNELTREGIEGLLAVGAPLRCEHQHGSTAAAGADPDNYQGMEFLFEGDYE